MSEHTPGPWSVAPGRLLMDYSAIGGAVQGGDGETFVSIRKSEHAEADVRLIAAAPDLLRALERLLDNGEMPHSLSGRDPTVRPEDVGPARAAIAKATGKESA